MTRLRPTWVDVDLDAIAHNVRALSFETGELMAVVKADAYGHGDVAVARTAIDAGASCFRAGIEPLHEIVVPTQGACELYEPIDAQHHGRPRAICRPSRQEGHHLTTVLVRSERFRRQIEPFLAQIPQQCLDRRRPRPGLLAHR